MTTPNPAGMPRSLPTPAPRGPESPHTPRDPEPASQAPWHLRRLHSARWRPTGATVSTAAVVAVTVAGSVRRPLVRVTVDGLGSLTFQPGGAFALATHLMRAADAARYTPKGEKTP